MRQALPVSLKSAIRTADDAFYRSAFLSTIRGPPGRHAFLRALNPGDCHAPQAKEAPHPQPQHRSFPKRNAGALEHSIPQPTSPPTGCNGPQEHPSRHRSRLPHMGSWEQPPAQILLVNTMIDISTDQGSVLPPDAAALVVDAAGERSFLIPDYPEDAKVPTMVQLLAAVLIRARDEEWVEEMLFDFGDALRSRPII